MDIYGLPEQLRHLGGSIIDADSHEMLPANEWVRLIGKDLQPMADYYTRFGDTEEFDKNTSNVPDFVRYDRPVGADILQVKGCKAAGAVDFGRRTDVMDAMGVHRQLMFPGAAAVYAMFLYRVAAQEGMMPFAQGSADDRRATALRIIERCSELMVDSARISDRIRPVPVLFGNTPQKIYARAKSYIDRGIRAMWLFPSGEPPAGRSPVHPDFDPLYALLAESNSSLILHTGGEGNFLATEQWDKAPALEGHIRHVEFSRSPWWSAKAHIEVENMITLLVVGGVFDRHPTLRVGLVETCSHWVGPLARRMDMWYGLDGIATGKLAEGKKRPYRLPEKPSFYMNRNVRVTPFFFEDFAFDIRNFPAIADMFCFSSDYPHVEGGKNFVETHYNKVKDLGDEAVERYFVTNGKWLLPD